MTYPLSVLLLLNYFAYVSTPLLYLYSLIFETWRYHPYKLLWVSIYWFNSQSRHGLAISPIIVRYGLCHLVKSLYWMYRLVVNRPVLNCTILFLVFDNCHNCIFFLLLSLLSVFILVILLVHLLCFLLLIGFFLLFVLSSISFSLSLCGLGSN